MWFLEHTALSYHVFTLDTQPIYTMCSTWNTQFIHTMDSFRLHRSSMSYSHMQAHNFPFHELTSEHTKYLYHVMCSHTSTQSIHTVGSNAHSLSNIMCSHTRAKFIPTICSYSSSLFIDSGAHTQAHIIYPYHLLTCEHTIFHSMCSYGSKQYIYTIAICSHASAQFIQTYCALTSTQFIHTICSHTSTKFILTMWSHVNIYPIHAMCSQASTVYPYHVLKGDHTIYRSMCLYVSTQFTHTERSPASTQFHPSVCSLAYTQFIHILCSHTSTPSILICAHTRAQNLSIPCA